MEFCEQLEKRLRAGIRRLKKERESFIEKEIAGSKAYFKRELSRAKENTRREREQWLEKDKEVNMLTSALVARSFEVTKIHDAYRTKFGDITL